MPWVTADVSGHEGTCCLVKHSVPHLLSPKQVGYKLPYNSSPASNGEAQLKRLVLAPESTVEESQRTQQAEELTPEKIHL